MEASRYHRKYELMTARDAKMELQKQCSGVKASLKDIQTLRDCFFAGNFEPMQSTRLYQKHGTEYCTLLEILS